MLMCAGVLCSCIKVERDYDLNRYDPDGEVFGDEFTAPLGRVETGIDHLLPIDDILARLDIPREEFENNPVTVPGKMIDARMEVEYDLGATIDGDLVNALSADGEIRIIAEIENAVDLDCNLVIAFVSASGDVGLELGATAADRCHVTAGTPGSTTTVRSEFTVTADDLKSVSDSDRIAIRFDRTDSDDATLYSDSRIVFRFTLYKSGGIKL